MLPLTIRLGRGESTRSDYPANPSAASVPRGALEGTPFRLHVCMFKLPPLRDLSAQSFPRYDKYRGAISLFSIQNGVLSKGQ